MKRNTLTVLTILAGGIMLGITSLQSESVIKQDQTGLSHHKSDGKFANTAADFSDDTSILPLLMRYITEKRIDSSPVNDIPVVTITAQQLEQLPQHEDSVIRLGHSSVFIKTGGKNWLIDPVFSERASPFSFAGPKRFHQPPIALESLPPIDGVIISHDHYDHLDQASIEYLASKVKHFVVPVGVDKHLKKWQVDAKNIHVLDWWQSVTIDNVSITATPTQHFSGRGLFDKNETLWASYVIKSANSNLYFSGDSGYFDGFKQIGERLGPFDLTMIETGAYDKDWASIHMTPEQSLQAHVDLQGRQMMPIHNGTFDLAFHSWYEPLERISELAQASGVPLLTPVMGQRVATSSANKTAPWWRDLQ